MLYRGSQFLLLWLAACQFAPSGGEAGFDDDGDPVDGPGDAGAAADAPAIDAPGIVLDAPVDARPPCPADYGLALGGSRYVRRGLAGIDAARGDCGDDLAGRTRLATFEDAAELAGVMAGVGASDGALWVGARCDYTLLGCEGAPSWTWDSGVAIAATMWSSAEPDNGLTETNAVAAKQPQGWALASVGGLFPLEGRPYVCECAE